MYNVPCAIEKLHMAHCTLQIDLPKIPLQTIPYFPFPTPVNRRNGFFLIACFISFAKALQLFPPFYLAKAKINEPSQTL